MVDLVATHRVSIIGGAPVFLNAMLRSGNLRDRDTSSLRAFLLGGDVVPPSVVEDAAAAGWTALRAYGLTEQPSISMGRPGDALDKRAHTDGRLVSLTDVRIVADGGEEGGEGEEGEIWVRGPGQCIGLLHEDDVVPATPDGWIRTGDLGSIDEEGYLRVSGRLKDVIIRGGEKISCGEVEEVLLRHPEVTDVAVAGAPDPFTGQRVVAFVVARRGQPLQLPSLARHCVEAGLAGHKVPKRLHVVDEVPRSALGKVQRYLLLQAAQAASERVEAAAT
jgi:cyclohexanecarboxylate-CoA ligase